MSEKIQFEITLDGIAAAQAQLDKFRETLSGGETAVTKIDKAIAQTEKDIKALNAAIASGEGNTKAYEQALSRLDGTFNSLDGSLKSTDTILAKIDKNIRETERDIKLLNAAIAAGGPNVDQYRAALTRLEGAKKNVGYAALELSRGIEDAQYGMAGLVNNIPGIVTALGGSMGLTAVISLAAIGINQLVKHFGDFQTEADKAKKKAEDLAEALGALREDRVADKVSTIDKMDKINEQLDKEIATFGKKKSAEIKFDIAKEKKETEQYLQEQKDRLAAQKEVYNAQNKILEENTAKLKGKAESSSFVLGNAIKQARALKNAAEIEMRSAEITVSETEDKYNQLELRGSEILGKANKLEDLEEKAKKKKDKKGSITDFHEIYDAKAKWAEYLVDQDEFYMKLEERRVNQLDRYKETKNGERALNEVATKDEIENIEFASDIYYQNLTRRIEAKKKFYDDEDKANAAYLKLQEKRKDKIDKFQGKVEGVDNNQFLAFLGLEKDYASERAAVDKLLTDEKINNLGRLTEAQYQQLDFALQKENAYFDAIQSKSTQVFGALGGIAEDYIERRIEGDKYAEKEALISLMRGAGNVLIGKGIESLGSAAAHTAEGNLPAAGVAAAIGLTLFSAGASIGGYAKFMGFEIGKQRDADSDAERDLEKAKKKAERDEGIRNKAGNIKGDGNIVLNLSYGVAGPLPEDTARLIAKELNAGRRRGVA